MRATKDVTRGRGLKVAKCSVQEISITTITVCLPIGEIVGSANLAGVKGY